MGGVVFLISAYLFVQWEEVFWFDVTLVYIPHTEVDLFLNIIMYAFGIFLIVRRDLDDLDPLGWLAGE